MTMLRNLKKLTKPPLLILRFFRRISSDAPSWLSANSIFQSHPRLLLLESCCSPRAVHAALAFTLVSGLFRNAFVASRVLHHFVSAPKPDAAFIAALFRQMLRPNIFSWNSMIRALLRSDVNHLSAFLVYVEMLERGVAPDKYTFPFLLKACRSASDLYLGKLVHGHALVVGLLADAFVQTELVNMYFACGCSRHALLVFDQMLQRDVVSWTAVISGLVDQGCNEDALKVLNDMRSEGSDATPNVATMVSTLSGCANLGSLVHARSLHAYVKKVGLEGDSFIGNSLVDAYAKCGSIACATKVFAAMRRDLHSWTIMIMGLASHGLGDEALQVFSQMEQIGIWPDSVTFVAVLSGCSHAGLVDEAIRIFDLMERVYDISPELKHYGCMVDLFGRAGILFRSYEFILNMPMKPNLAILGALLSACRFHHNKEMGKVATKMIEAMCEHKGGSYVLLSNIYANEHQWNEVASIRKATRGDQSKPPGQSWVEVGGIIHEFVADDKSHPFASEIQLVLDGLENLMDVL